MDATFHTPEWHAARIAALTTERMSWEDWKKQQKEEAQTAEAQVRAHSLPLLASAMRTILLPRMVFACLLQSTHRGRGLILSHHWACMHARSSFTEVRGAGT